MKNRARRETNGGSAFRLRGHLWSPILVPFAVITGAAVLAAYVGTFAEPRGPLDVGYWAFLLGRPLVIALAAYSAWHVFMAWGLVPMFLVWRTGESVFIGTLPSRVGMSRCRLSVSQHDLRADFVDSHRPQPRFGHVTHLRFESASQSIEIRTFGRVEADAVEAFVVDRVSRLTGA